MDRNKVTRRSFLAFSSLAAASILAACAAPAASPTAAPTQAPAAKATEAPKPTTAPAATTAAGSPTAAATAAAKPTTAATAAATPATTGPTPTLKPGALNTPTPEPTPVIAQVTVKAGQTKIDWWTPRGDAVSLQAEGQAADAFNKKQDKYVVQIVYVPTTAGTQMSEKLLTSIAAGTPPNTSEFDRFIVSSWAAQGALTDLTDRAKAASITADQFYPFAWEEASYKSKLYAMPDDTDTRGIYYNIDLFSKAGVDPKSIKTIADLDAAAEKLTIKEGRQFKQWGYSPIYNQSFHYAVALEWAPPNFDKMYDKATNTCTANAQSNVDAFTWIKSYADKYNIQDMEAFQSAFGTQANNPFYTGQIAMYAQGDWGLADITKFAPNLNFGVMPMPGKTGPAPCMAGGWSEVIPKGAKEQDGGWEWVSYYGGPEGQLIYCKGTMHIPTNIKASQDPAFTADPKHAQFMDFLKTALNRPAIPAGQTLWNELGTASSNVAHGVMTPKQALDVVKQKTDAELAKYP